MSQTTAENAPRWSVLRWVTRNRSLRGKKYDVVFYLPTTSKVLVDRPGVPPSGGAETQISILMRRLAANGHAVALVSFELPGGLPATVEGIDIFIRRPYAGRLGRQINRLKRIHGLLTETFTVFSVGLLFPARTVVQRTASVNTGLLSLGCRLSGRRFVWSSANDFDFEFENFSKSQAQLRVYRWGVRSATAIVVQTSLQADLCRRVFARDPFVIMSLAEPATQAGQPSTPGPILWIGRAIEYKDPLRFVSIAKENPDLHFAMIAVPEDGEAKHLFDEVESACAKAGNIDFHGPLNRSEVLEMTAGATAIANTSTFEGMPNVFLEGWARGVPAVSLNVDPDGVIERFGLGTIAHGNNEAFAQGARSLADNPDLRARIGSQCTEYVKSSHSPAVIAGRWEEVLELRPSTIADGSSLGGGRT